MITYITDMILKTEMIAKSVNASPEVRLAADAALKKLIDLRDALQYMYKQQAGEIPLAKVIPFRSKLKVLQ
jgi:hypothetical protein